MEEINPRSKQSRFDSTEEEDEPHHRPTIQSHEMKALLKKWYGLPKKDRQRIQSDDEDGQNKSSSTAEASSSSLTPSSSSNLLYDIPKKRRRYHHNPPLISSGALIPVYSSSSRNREEEEDPGGGRGTMEDDTDLPPEEEDEEPQNLVMMESQRRNEDAQNNNSKNSPLQEPQEEIRDGICSWCLQTLDQPRSCQFSMSILDDPKTKRSKTFCSERCFTLYRRAAFKKNKYCDLCKKPTTSPTCTQYQTSFGDNLIFCSDSCLKTYKIDESSRREKMAALARRPPLSDKQSIAPLQNKKISSKTIRRPQEKSYSQTPVVKVKPDMALKSSDVASRKKPQPTSTTNHSLLLQQQRQTLSEQIPVSAPAHSFHHPMIPPPATLRHPFLGMIQEHPTQASTSGQPLLPLAALAGALAAAASSSRSLPPPNGRPPLSLPSPLTLCPTPFFIPLPIPIPMLIPVPEKLFKAQGFSESLPGTSQDLSPSIKREASSPNPNKDGPIKTECLSDDERRTRKREFPQNTFD